MTCLDDERVLGLVEGRLGPDALTIVDAHLDTCASCREVVAHLARTRATVLERGSPLGRYVVGDLLGAGATGRVYSAWEPELDRRVAIKVLDDDAPGAHDRLLREAKAMARLDHPNVVGVHEVGRSEHGVYVAMDLVDGETLRAWVGAARPWHARARVLADIARGLAAVHAAGVLHRDVKPDNVIIGVDGRARIGDFGLARAGPSPRATPTELLAIGAARTAVAGTPAYMAPEVLRGGSATEASDQFAFGVTAYELIAGRRPFRPPDSVGAGFEGWSVAALARAIETGSVARVRGVPGWLDAAIRTCLAVDPAHRHPSMAAVARALDDGARRRRPAWLAAATGAAIVASALTFAATAGRPACDTDAIDPTWNAAIRAALPLDAPSLAAIDRWTASWRASRTAVCLAAATEPAVRIAARERCLDQRRLELEALIVRTAAVGAGEHDPRERLVDGLAALPPSECASLPLGAADPEPLDPERRAIVDAVLDTLPSVRAAIALGDARPVAETLDGLVTDARRSGHAPTLADVLLVRAEAWRVQSNLPEAAIAARDAAAAAERGHDDLAAARAWLERMAIAGDRRDLVAADDLAAMTSAAVDRAGAPPHLVARLARLCGIVAFHRGRLDEARALLLEARAGFAAIAGETSVEVAGVETSLGAVARVANDLDAAERHHQRAFEIDRALRGESHPELARDLHNLAGIARLRGDLDGALALYTRALAIEDAARGETSVESALTHNSLGLVHMARREWTEAAVEVAFARDAFRAAGHGDLALAEHNLGLVRAATGDHEAALVQFDAAATDYARTIGAEASAPIRLFLDRARSRLAVGDTGGARSDAARARTLADGRIAWIVEDADAILAGVPRGGGGPSPTGPTVVPAPALPAPEPVRIDAPPVPAGVLASPPAPPVPAPPREVGVYGSSQGG